MSQPTPTESLRVAREVLRVARVRRLHEVAEEIASDRAPIYRSHAYAELEQLLADAYDA